MALQPAKPNFKKHVLQNLKPGERPAIHHWEVESESERLSLSIDSDDLWRIALQKDDKSVWMLSSVDPIEWKFIGGSGDSPAPVNPTPSTVTWNDIQNKPTSIVDSGITDVYTKTEVNQLVSVGGIAFKREHFNQLNTNTFSLSEVPSFILSLLLNGVSLSEGIDYSIINKEITLNIDWVLKNSDNIFVTFI